MFAWSIPLINIRFRMFRITMNFYACTFVLFWHDFHHVSRIASLLSVLLGALVTMTSKFTRFLNWFGLMLKLAYIGFFII